MTVVSTSARALPPLLQPWAAQLSLFPAELALVLGDMLLRLQPLVAPIARRGMDTAAEPAGAGDIARRGSYDRLLIGEWALADAAPDEFLRRAANNELLFTGPEPARSTASLRSIALFDAGPSQLGAPRLAHLALFVLLARRAELAGAAFQWGALQQPGELHADADRHAVQRLLDARVWTGAQPADAAAWDAALDGALTDCWLVGDEAAPRPARVHAVAAVRQTWEGDQLAVDLVTRGRGASVHLALPPMPLGARLLRHPFAEEAPSGARDVASDAISRKRPPLFGNTRDRVGVCMVDGSATLFHVPQKPGAKPGRPRRPGKIRHLDATIAAGVFQKTLGTVALRDDKLTFTGFPGHFFTNHDHSLPRRDQFHAVPGALNWGRAFHQVVRHATLAIERVLLLDREGRLVSWTVSGDKKSMRISRTEFGVVAANVIGAIQQDDRVLFAVRGGDRIDVYALAAVNGPNTHLHHIMHDADHFHFGGTAYWHGAGHLFAARRAKDTWLVGRQKNIAEVKVDADDRVLGCAHLSYAEPAGLVVLTAGRTRIDLVRADGRKNLVKATEPIVQASYDPEFGRLAWLLDRSGVLTVQRLGDDQPLLRTLPREGQS